MKISSLFVVSTAALICSGCLSMKSYVDQSYSKVRYEDLSKSGQALALRVNVEFLRNGTRFPKADGELRGHVERVLRGSGLITPSASADGEITIAVDNVGDRGAAAAKGVGTGLTLGLAGSTVQDAYTMTVTLNAGGKTVTKAGYKHVLITTVGRKQAPAGLTPTTPTAGFGTVVEQMLLNALSDLQKDGLLVRSNRPVPSVVATPNAREGFFRASMACAGGGLLQGLVRGVPAVPNPRRGDSRAGSLGEVSKPGAWLPKTDSPRTRGRDKGE